MNSLEWRLQAPEADHTEWVIGTYMRDESEDLSRRYTYLPEPFGSSLDTQTLAIFGQINWTTNKQISGFVGARLEQRDSEYRDSANVEKDFDHNYWTGRLGLVWHYQDDRQVYAMLSRGARADPAAEGAI